MTVSTTWPWNDPDLISDFDFTTGQYYSGSLGVITLEQAIDCERNSNGTVTDLAFNSAGLLESFAHNAPRVTDLGLWCETTSTARLDATINLDNVAWTSTNLTLAQDLPSPFAAGTPLGWRLTATAANATITQSTDVILPASADNFTVPHALFYWDGTELAGAIELTQDGFVINTDIRSQLVAGTWKYICGDIKVLDGDPKEFGVRIVAQGDSIGMMMPNVTRSPVVTSPIGVTVAQPNRTRLDDMHRQILANFPTLWDKTEFTVLTVVTPRLFPFIPVGSLSPLPTRRGFTSFEINKNYNETALGRGNIIDDVMTVETYTSGAFVPGDVISTGTGAITATRIVEQLTGTPGELGTYLTHSIYSGTGTFPPTQTTFLDDIVLQARSPDAVGYALNAAVKTDDLSFTQHVGVTINVEEVDPEDDMFYGFDPLGELYRYDEPNAEGFTINSTAREGTVSLRGNSFVTDHGHFTNEPILTDDYEIIWGANGIIGGTLLNGTVQRGIIIGRRLSDTELNEATLALQNHYTNQTGTMTTSRFLRAPLRTRNVTGGTSTGGSSTTVISVHVNGQVSFNDRRGNTWRFDVPVNYTTEAKDTVQTDTTVPQGNAANALYALIDALIART